ncbi:Uncharacterised protein [Achromobacter sp. 2789STDY5608621]|nr:Uncharacterised protein [Achromobacter sp. 2789STDY5608621]
MEARCRMAKGLPFNHEKMGESNEHLLILKFISEDIFSVYILLLCGQVGNEVCDSYEPAIF